MTTITFQIKDEVARRWERVLRSQMAGSVGEKVNNLTLDQLMKLASYHYMADLAQAESELALRELEDSLDK
jgi:hypothetical protein